MDGKGGELTVESISNMTISSEVDKNQEKLSNLNSYCKGIEGIINDSKNKLNKEVKSSIIGLLGKIQVEMSKLSLENMWLAGRSSQKINDFINKSDNTTNLGNPQKKSYACAALGAPSRSITIEGKQREVPVMKPTVIFYPEIPEGKTSEQTKEIISKVLNPKDDGFQPVKTRKIKGGGFLLQTSNCEGINNIKKKIEKLTATGIKMILPQGRLPKIVLYDVPKGEASKDSALFDEIYVNNIEGKSSVNKEDYMRTIRRVSLFGKRDLSTMNMVITCHPEIRNILIDSGRCYLGWNACKVRDFWGATRCFKCHMYGHVSKSCTAETITCRHCAASGHDFQDCTKKTEAAVCATCRKFRKPDNHRTGDRNCPAHCAAIEAQVSMTDYGRR